MRKSKITIDGELLEGSFIERKNRFIAHININGVEEVVHVANTGRMQELLVVDARVICRYVDSPTRKTKYDLVMVEKDNNWVLIDSKVPNIIIEKALSDGLLTELGSYDEVRREVTYGKSRFDIAGVSEGQVTLIECKCVTLVREDGVASFPDAPTIRGTKHVLELIHAKEHGYRAIVVFLIQRPDAHMFTPNGSMDPAFEEAVIKAHKAGVEFYAYTCEVTPSYIEIKDQLPIEY